MEKETRTITIHVSAAHLAALNKIARRSSEKLGTAIDPDVVAGVLLAQALEQRRDCQEKTIEASPATQR